MKPLAPAARAYVLGVILLGAAIWSHSIADLIRNPPGVEWLLLVALTVGSGWATLRIPAMPISFSISDLFNIVAALLFGPSAGAITAALDGLVLSARMATDDRSLHRVFFNMAAVSIALWVAAQVFFAIEGNRPEIDGPIAALRLLATLLLFGTIDFGLNSAIVAAAVSFERSISIRSIWRAHLAGVWITYFGGIFGAMLVLLLARFGTLETVILIAPLPVLLYITFRHALGRATDQIDHLAKVNRVYIGAIEALAHAVDAKDEVTHDHTRRVQDETMRVARALAVDDDGELQAIRAAALLHDVGKLAIPEHILNKPGRLTAAEYEIMKRHASIGADILAVIGFPYAVVPIVRHHHENWDGSGYPDGLAGSRIPIGSRILAVVDCFDALTSDRPYRPAMTDEEALAILGDRRGTMYDPHVVDTFFALHGARVPAASASAAVARPPKAQGPVDHLAGRTDQGREQRELQAFFDLGRALAAPDAPQRLGEIVWAHLGGIVPATALVFYVCDDAAHALIPLAVAGEATLHLGTTPIAMGERVSGWVAATGQAAVNSDPRLDFDAPCRDEAALKSALVVPVPADGRVVGVLSLYASAPNAFDDIHRRLLEVSARAIAPLVVCSLQDSTRVLKGLTQA
jgi:putative nucleotidyltransferase with HDIG domain